MLSLKSPTAFFNAWSHKKKTVNTHIERLTERAALAICWIYVQYCTCDPSHVLIAVTHTCSAVYAMWLLQYLKQEVTGESTA